LFLNFYLSSFSCSIELKSAIICTQLDSVGGFLVVAILFGFAPNFLRTT